MSPAVKYGQIIEYIPGSCPSSFIHPSSCADYHIIHPGQTSFSNLIMDIAMCSGALADAEMIAQQLGVSSRRQQQCAPLLPYSWLIYTDRLYLAAYTTPPSTDTLFPYPDPPASRRSPSKRSQRPVEVPVLSERDRTPPCYFSIDDSLLYNAFHHDFGPLHIGHLYRFAVQFHDILGAPENKSRPVVFWSKADARSK